MAKEYKIILDPEIQKTAEKYGIHFNSCNYYKPKRQLMATDVIRELKKLIEENGDKPVFVSTGFEYCDAYKVSTYSDGSIRIGT